MPDRNGHACRTRPRRERDWRDAKNAAQGDDAYATARVIDDDRGKFVEWDVTRLVAEWLAGKCPNQGFFLRTVGDGGTIKFASRESKQSDQRPRLVVVGTNGSVELSPQADTFLFRYYLRLANDWNQTVQGGKMPGISGTYGVAGWGGRKVDGTDDWSARGSFGLSIPEDNPLGGLHPLGTYSAGVPYRGHALAQVPAYLTQTPSKKGALPISPQPPPDSTARKAPHDRRVSDNWINIESREGYETKHGESRMVPIHSRLRSYLKGCYGNGALRHRRVSGRRWR